MAGSSSGGGLGQPEPPQRQARFWNRPIRIPRPDQAELTALCALAAIGLFLFRDAVFRGRVFYQRDVHSVWFEYSQAFTRVVTSGSWPLWDPFVGFGQPMLANPATQVLYPLTWLHLLMSPGSQFTIHLMAHLILSGWGLYRLALRLELKPGASLVAAALWITSGPYLSLGNNVHHFAGASWIPCALWLAVRTLDSGRPRDAVWCGLGFGAQFLAGSADMSLFTALIAASLGLRRLIWRRPEQPARLRVIAVGALAGILALGVAAAQWMPTLAIARRSERWSLESSARTYWSAHPIKMLQALVPVLAHELPLRDSDRALLYESRGPFLPSFYLGAAALLLVMGALAAPRRPHVHFLLGLALAAALVAMGRHTQVYQVAIALVPPLRMVRYPEKLMLVVALAWALLGGIGFAAWREGALRGRRRLLVLLPSVILATALWSLAWAAGVQAEQWGPRLLSPEELSWHSFGETLAPYAQQLALSALLVTLSAAGIALGQRLLRLGPALAAIASLADLCLFHAKLNPTASPELLAYRPPLAQLIRQDDQRRLYVYEYAMLLGRSQRYLGRESPYLYQGVPKEWPSDQVDALAARSYLLPPVAGAWGIYGSYELDLLGLYPRELSQLTQMLRSVELTPVHRRLLQMGAVSQLVALHTQGFEDLRPIANLKGYYPEPIHLYQVPDPLPRGLVVGAARVADGADALVALADPGFDPAREVLLAEGPALTAEADFHGTAQLLELKPDRVRIQAELSSPGWLVLVDAYDPGWRASIDGVPAQVLRANLGFRAVRLPAGKHQVWFAYRPSSVVIGLTVSAVTLLAGIFLSRFQ